jgi:hypothetical protein
LVRVGPWKRKCSEQNLETKLPYGYYGKAIVGKKQNQKTSSWKVIQNSQAPARNEIV